MVLQGSVESNPSSVIPPLRFICPGLAWLHRLGSVAAGSVSHPASRSKLRRLPAHAPWQTARMSRYLSPASLALKITSVGWLSRDLSQILAELVIAFSLGHYPLTSLRGYALCLASMSVSPRNTFGLGWCWVSPLDNHPKEV